MGEGVRGNFGLGIWESDEFEKVEIIMCLVFGVSCFAFSMELHFLYQYVIPLNTKHQILNNLVKRSFFYFFETVKLVF